jgi:hypothetical protein
MLIEGEISEQAFELGILLAQLPQLFQRRCAEVGVLLPPDVEGGIR